MPTQSFIWPTFVDLATATSVDCVLVSDTHGELDHRIAEVVRDADLVIHAGDIGSDAVLEILKTAKCCVAVTGNNDVASQWDVPDIPPECRIALPGGALVVEHGHRRNPARTRHDKLRARHADTRAVVYGHSHQLCLDQSATPVVVNPGASGRVRTHGGPSYGRLVASTNEWAFELKRLPFEARTLVPAQNAASVSSPS